MLIRIVLAYMAFSLGFMFCGWFFVFGAFIHGLATLTQATK